MSIITEYSCNDTVVVIWCTTSVDENAYCPLKNFNYFLLLIYFHQVFFLFSNMPRIDAIRPIQIKARLSGEDNSPEECNSLGKKMQVHVYYNISWPVQYTMWNEIIILCSFNLCHVITHATYSTWLHPSSATILRK